MIIKKIAKICRERRGLVNFNHKGKLWVGTHFAFYSLCEMPDMSVDQIATLFDYNEKTKKRMSFSDGYVWKPLLYGEDLPENQFDAKSPEDAVINGQPVKIFRKNDGDVIFCDATLFAPFEDEETTNGLFYFLRRYANADVIAVKSGFELVGLILSMNFSKEKISAWISDEQRLLFDVQGYLDRLSQKPQNEMELEDDDEQLFMFNEDEDNE